MKNGVTKGLLYIHGIGHFHPDNVLDNDFLENLDIGTSSKWISKHVGIVSRRTVLPLDYISDTRNSKPQVAQEAAEYSNAETGRIASEMALSRAGISAGDVGLVIAGGCSPQWTIPAEACAIANLLGIEAPAYDLNSACSSFGLQIHNLLQMHADALPDYILLVSPENNTRVIDYNDRDSAVLWGDGTSAVVVSPRIPSRAKVVASVMRSDPGGWQQVMIPRIGHFKQNGRAVQKFAIRRTLDTILELREIANGNGTANLHFIGHQANLRMLQSVCKYGEIAPRNHFYNVNFFGNTGAAGAPIVMSQNWETFQPGDRLALIVVGSGLTWAGMLIEFGAS